MAKTNYLNPEVLARLSRLDLKARLVVEGFMSGLHTSPYKGFSQEFADYRPYIAGDETKRIDWKVYGRRDRFYIKEYQEETSLRAYILFDKSGSMAYGHKISKIEYSKYLGASLAYLLYRQKDSVGIATFDTKIDQIITPSSKKISFLQILKVIDQAEAHGETSLNEVLSKLAQKLKRRGLIIIISDLLDEPIEIVKALRSFRSRKHEILVFQVLDPDELNFPFSEPSKFYDLENKSEMIIQPALLRTSYQKRFKAMLDFYQHKLLEFNIDYVMLNTATEYGRALFAYLEKRGKLH
jgi:uncharacterized protein (DUF58 family)